MVRGRNQMKTPRRGFTMVELIIVILIIVILAALLLSGVASALKTSKMNSTQAVMQTVHDELRIRWDAFWSTYTADRYVRDKNTSPPNPAHNPIRDELANDSGQNQAANIREREILLWQLDLLRSDFPQEFGDFLQDAWSTASTMTPVRQKYIQFYNEFFNASRHNPATQSGACLYMILRFNSPSGVSFNFDSLPKWAVQDTDGDNLPEIVDAWSTPSEPRPLRFYRWPVDLYIHLATLRGMPTVSLRSNVDPKGVLTQTPAPTSYRGWFDAKRAQFENASSVPVGAEDSSGLPLPGAPPLVSPFDVNNPPAGLNNGQPRHRYFRLHKAYVNAEVPSSLPDVTVPVAYPLVPMIVSAGADGDFGLVDFAANSAPYDWLSVRMGRPDPARIDFTKDNLYTFSVETPGARP